MGSQGLELMTFMSLMQYSACQATGCRGRFVPVTSWKCLRKEEYPLYTTSYLCDILSCDGKEVHLVSKPLGGLHCGNVWIDEDRLDVLLLQCLYGLQRAPNAGEGGTICQRSCTTNEAFAAFTAHSQVLEPLAFPRPVAWVCSPGSQNSQTPQPGQWISHPSPGSALSGGAQSHPFWGLQRR